ncbi:hypothetical protein SDC9_151088 [bioreactor metagenome]|uniref:Uncharacterized protein n=1 Tax=bioreactor metagenome TaxID=1076179 RepID=A0A645ETM5_9ZZZZ
MAHRAFAMSHARRAGRHRRCGRLVRRRRLVGSTLLRARAHPQQPDDQHVQHDQTLPEKLVGEVEHRHVPLPQVEQADHAHHVQRLNGHEARHKAHQLVSPAGRKRDDGREQHDAGLDAVASRLDRHTETRGAVPQHLALCRGGLVEPHHQRRTNLRQRGRPRQHDVLLHPVEHVQAEQRELDREK